MSSLEAEETAVLCRPIGPKELTLIEYPAIEFFRQDWPVSRSFIPSRKSLPNFTANENAPDFRRRFF